MDINLVNNDIHDLLHDLAFDFEDSADIFEDLKQVKQVKNKNFAGSVSDIPEQLTSLQVVHYPRILLSHFNKGCFQQLSNFLNDRVVSNCRLTWEFANSTKIMKNNIDSFRSLYYSMLNAYPDTYIQIKKCDYKIVDSYVYIRWKYSQYGTIVHPRYIEQFFSEAVNGSVTVNMYEQLKFLMATLTPNQYFRFRSKGVSYLVVDHNTSRIVSYYNNSKKSEFIKIEIEKDSAAYANLKRETTIENMIDCLK